MKRRPKKSFVQPETDGGELIADKYQKSNAQRAKKKPKTTPELNQRSSRQRAKKNFGQIGKLNRQ